MKYLKYFETNDIDPFAQEDWEEKDLYDVSKEDQEWAKTKSDKWFYFLSVIGTNDMKIEIDGIKAQLTYDEKLKAFKNSKDDDLISVEEVKNRKLITTDNMQDTIILEEWDEFTHHFSIELFKCVVGFNSFIRLFKERNIDDENVLNNLRGLKMIYETIIKKENHDIIKKILNDFNKGNIYLHDLFEKYITNK